MNTNIVQLRLNSRFSAGRLLTKIKFLNLLPILISHFRTRKSKPRQTKKSKPPSLDEIDFKEEIQEDLTDAILDEHDDIDDEDKPLKPKKKRKPRAKPAPGKCCKNQRIFLLYFNNVTKLLRCSLDHVS